MQLLLAGWLAFGLALFWDWFLRVRGIKERWRIGLAIPIAEEIIKFSICWWFWFWPPLIYLIFGFSEGFYEGLILKKRIDPTLILAATLTHLGFGLGFWFKLPGWLSLCLAIMIHLGWNNLIIRQQIGYNHSSK